MKKNVIIFTFIASLLTCGNALGQVPGSLSTIASNGNLNMVRYDAATGEFIAASPHSGGVIHFIKTDLINFTEVKLDVVATIMDFEIIDRFIFFCGEGNTPYGGILGCFNIDSLFALGGGAHIDMNLYSTVGLSSLRNIEVYKKEPNSNIYFIAGYGRDASLYPVAFEAVGHPYTGMKYRTLLLEYDNYKSEILDMAVTENYVVYLRHEVRNLYPCNPNYIFGATLIPFKKYNMFDPPLDSAYYFQTSVISLFGAILYVENIEPAGDRSSKIVHVGGDNVAICAHRRDNDFENCYNSFLDLCYCEINDYVKTFLTLRNYDLAPLASNRPIAMTSAYAAELVNGETSYIQGFKYDHPSRSYLALHRHETAPSVFEDCVTTFDFSGGTPAYASSEYQTIYSTSSVWRPFSLCLDNSSRYLVCGADRMTYTPYYFWFNDVVGSTVSSCNNIIYNPVVNLPLIQEKGLVNLKTPTSWFLFSFENHNSLVVQKALCEQICP